MRNIVAAVEFSERAADNLAAAASLAEDGAEITLLHVVEIVRSTPFLESGEFAPFTDEETRFNMELIGKSREWLHGMVDEGQSRLRQRNIHLRSALRVGESYPVIMEFLQKSKAELLVIGAHHNPDHEYAMEGSLPDRVVRMSASPVLTVHHASDGAGYRDIVFASEMEADELPLLRVIRRIADKTDAMVHVVRINTPGDFQRDRPVIDFMKDFVERAGLNRFTLNTYNEITVEDGIHGFADSVNADLVALATHGRRGLARLFSSSIAEEIAAVSQRPILTMRVEKGKR